jgi:programmed cell death 6-interacting protein
MKAVEHLCLTRAELEASIPASTINSTLSLKDPNVKQLKLCLDQLNMNIKKRVEIIQRLKDISATDDIGPRLMQAAAQANEIDECIIFPEQMKPYVSQSEEIDSLLTGQTSLLASINVR